MKLIQIISAGNSTSINTRLRELVAKTQDIDLVATAKNGDELLNKLRAVSYDLVLMDISMKGKSSMDVLKEIKQKYKAVPVVVFSMAPDKTYAVPAFNNGALAYVSKRTNSDQLIRILRIAAAGNKFRFPHQVKLLEEVIGERK